MPLGEQRPDVSILIVSWNTLELTRACLDSIPVGLTGGESYEVIVVDNGSSDGSVEWLRERPEVHLVENDGNRGFAAAVNQAYGASSGRLVLLLNSDIEFKPGSLSALVDFLAQHPGVAGVGPLYLNPDGSPQQHHFRLPTLPMLVASTNRVLRPLPGLAHSERRYRMIGEDFSRPRPVEQPSASVLLLRREVLPADHLLDEAFPIYFNDVELAYRLRQAGHELWMTPASEVFHVHGASTRRLGGALQRQYLAALVRYIDISRPAYAGAIFRLCAFPPKAALALSGRPGALSLRELRLALRGDPGPLPGG
jgi:GT2 family glycosyltransferase